MEKPTLKIECHILQNFAPSCLNRDDTNSPKDCEFGGARRARVSSQSWKRAMRDFFKAQNSVTTGIRTKHLQEWLTERLGEDVPAEAVKTFVSAYYSQMDKKRADETAVLVFIGEPEINAATALIREEQAALMKKDYKPSKTVSEKLKATASSADLALFGRMLAEQPDRNIDAACQVAHAISTHQVDMEMDFYTAVDDLTKDRDETGAGMLGTQGYNSACFYRYALLDTNLLQSNLGGDAAMAANAVEAFLQAFCLSIPSAKQNSHGAQNLPSLALFIARDNGVPVSLANAFARPIYQRRDDDLDNGLIDESVKAIGRYFDRIGTVYGLYSDATISVFHDRETDKPLDALAKYDAGSFAKAMAVVMERVRA